MVEKKTTDNEANWSGAAKVGAAIGSAALVAALLYAGRRNLAPKKGKLEPQSPPADPLRTDNKAGAALKKTKPKTTKPKTTK